MEKHDLGRFIRNLQLQMQQVLVAQLQQMAILFVLDRLAMTAY